MPAYNNLIILSLLVFVTRATCPDYDGMELETLSNAIWIDGDSIIQQIITMGLR